MFLTPCSAASNASIIATAFEVLGGTNVPVNGPNGSLLIVTPAASYSPTNLSQYCQSLILFSDRKSTRLNSSHANISYAVFCLKKKKAPLADLLRLLGTELTCGKTRV